WVLSAPCSTGATDRDTDRCCSIAAGSWSHTVDPSVTDPARGIVLVCASSASTSVVLPEPEGPTSATLRISAGSDGAGAGRVPAVTVCLLPMVSPCCSRCETEHTPGAPGVQGHLGR